MSPLDLLRFSAGALRGHRLRTGLSLLGVAIGVASVILLTSLGEGARRYVTGEFEALGSNLLIVLPGRTETTGLAPLFGGVANDLTLDDAAALPQRIAAVRRVAPISIGSATARYRDRSREVLVAGTTADFQPIRGVPIAYGQYLPPGEAERARPVCVLGWKIRQELFPDLNPLGRFLRLGDRRFRIIGVMAPRGMSMGNDLDEMVHVPVALQMRMFNLSSLFRVIVEVRSHEEIPATRLAVLRVLRERHDGAEDVTVFTQDAVLSTFGRIFTVLTAALGGIASVSLSVAGVGIMNVMLVSVSERTAEIGLLKALGVTRGQILAAFVVEAAILSTAGGLLGLGSGLGGARVLQAIYPRFPVHAPAWAVAAALAVSVAVGLLFGALPARRAARLEPVAALAARR
jgi:putative ABC transport system permease protein